MGKKKTILGVERTLILKVCKFFEQEKINGTTIPLKQVEKRVCAATGISRRTLTRIKKEAEIVLHNQALPGPSSETPEAPVILSTPGKKRVQKKKLEIDDFTICAIKTNS